MGIQTSGPVRPARRRFAALLCLALVAPPAPAVTVDTELPDIGSAAGVILSPAEEERLGKAFMRHIRITQPVLEEPLIEDYVQQLGLKLVQHSTGSGNRFRFFTIDNPQVNAFAGPAGHIGINTGLILTAEDESELAAVLAHEIAHVTQNHLRRTWQAASKLNIQQAMVMLAAIALGAAVGGDAAAATAFAGQAGLLQTQIDHIRANEKEADRVGIGILAEAGYETRAMPGFFGRMGRTARLESTRPPEFLLTHPVTTSRIADSLGRAEQFPYRQRALSLRFHLTRADLRQRSHADPGQAVLRFSQALTDGRYRSEDAERYGLALALARARRHTEARQEIDKLIAAHPDSVEIRYLSAREWSVVGDTDRALATLDDGLLRAPSSYPLSLLKAEVLSDTGRHADAYRVLKSQVELRPEDARLRERLGRAAARIGKPHEGYEQMAEHHYLRGELEAALRQYEIALRTKGLGDFEAARLQSRLDELRDEKRALAAKRN